VTSEWEKHQYEDLMLEARVRLANESVMDFEVYRLVVNKDNAYGYPSDEDGSYTLETSDSYVLVSGHIKFDGCSNIQFYPIRPSISVHSCTRKELTSLGPLFNELFDLAKQMIKDPIFI